MTMIISQANSMRFRKVNSDLPNFDNTLTANEKFYNDKIETYLQRWNTSDVVTVQIKSDSATVPTIVVTSDDNSTSSIVCIGNTYKSRYDTNGGTTYNLWFFEFQVVMSFYQVETFVTVTQGTDIYKSEPFIGDIEIDSELSNGETLKLEYANNDNAFQIDFSTLITFTLYIKAIIKDYETGGDISVYDNQDEIEKLKETAKRIFSFKTLHIPRYLAETLKIASSMDNLVINDVAFVREDQPDISPVDGNNFVEYSMNVSDKEYLGLNTHDIGFDVDLIIGGEEMIILSKDDATGAETFEVEAGYLVHTLRANWVSGSTVLVKLGTTVGGDELVYEFPMSASILNITVAIHGDINRAANANIYLTVTGGVVDVDIQTLKNTQ
jgi:hypothetical protein